MSDCGCPQSSPSPLNCGPTLQIPVEQFECQQTGGQAPSASAVTFHQALSSFVVPNVGQQSQLLVADGSIFAAGQWIQFVNPSGIFRIISITGNTLFLQNAAADGVTAIDENPIPPYQYMTGAAFVTVGDPRQPSLAEFATRVQEAIASLQSVCLSNVSEKTNTEQVFLLGYLKSVSCGPNEGACLRKQDLAYIDENGILHFDGTIVADNFNVPVPAGGIPNNNSTSLNPNNGASGGFLLPFYNPTTGSVSYINLFSGVTNGSTYNISVSPTGQISLASAPTSFIKAWTTFDGVPAGPTLPSRSQSNVASVTKVSTGRYRITFTTPMPNTNYAVLVTVGDTLRTHAISGAEITSTRLANSVEIQTAVSTENSSSNADFTSINVMILSL